MSVVLIAVIGIMHIVVLGKLLYTISKVERGGRSALVAIFVTFVVLGVLFTASLFLHVYVGYERSDSFL
jgi:hypothetical protein